MATEVTQSEAVWGAVMTSALKGGAQGWAEPWSPRETGVGLVAGVRERLIELPALRQPCTLFPPGDFIWKIGVFVLYEEC